MTTKAKIALLLVMAVAIQMPVAVMIPISMGLPSITIEASYVTLFVDVLLLTLGLSILLMGVDRK